MVVAICALGLALGLLVLLSDSIASNDGTSDDIYSQMQTTPRNALETAPKETNESQIHRVNRKTSEIAPQEANGSQNDINVTGSSVSKEAPIVNLIGGYEPQDTAKTLPIWQKSASMGMVYFTWERSSLKSVRKPDVCPEYWESELIANEKDSMATSKSRGRGLSSTSGIDTILPIPEGTETHCLDTEIGSIEFYWDIVEPLPLCITDENVDDYFHLYARVVGLYMPTDYFQVVCVYQDKMGWMGAMWLDWYWYAYQPCYADYWFADFSVLEGWRSDNIELASNHKPYVINGYPIDYEPGECLDKWVHLYLASSWTGCDQPEQEFVVISAGDKIDFPLR
ncbi:MAG: hypothetical protein ACFFDT_10950 [Candidatus Hodarchaeota archaeon]